MSLDLFPYQEQAFDMFMDRGSLLLALDTGLGKTATAIAIAEDLLERRLVRSVLIVVPSNLKYQWAKSISRFTDIPSRVVKVKRKPITIPEEQYCAVIDGDPARRQRIYEMARLSRPEYVIVGYDTLVSDHDEYISGLGCTFVVLDEASMIKTPSAERTQAIKEYTGRTPFRLALTATPIENAPEDVYSIMQWVDRTVLGRFDLFDKAYIRRDSNGGVMGYRNLDVLWGRLSGAMFRRKRTDPDVKAFMPDVEHHVWEVDTSPEILEAYVSMCRDLVEAYDQAPGRTGGSWSLSAHYGMGGSNNDKGNMGKVMGIHTCMEMLLDYPMLIEYSADKYQDETVQGGSEYAARLVDNGFVASRETPKLDYIKRRVDNILTTDEDAKVILFSRYRGTVDILVRDFQSLGYKVVEYHGELSNSAKEAAVSTFLDDEDVRLFISSHAGAYGTDLPVANWLINIDLPWGHGLGTQINGRHVRASSEFACVYVVDVVVRGSIEERKVAVRDFKGAIADAAVDGNGKATIIRDVQALIAHAKEVIQAWEDPEYDSN